ncbi:MAG: AgmX/PglI C-terminal domain-containing protein [Spirochaetota bacterium]
MDNKSILVFVLSLTLILSVGFFFYNSHQQQQMYLRTMQGIQYNLSKSQGKRKYKDPYKSIAVNNTLRKKARTVQECYNRFVAEGHNKSDGFVEIDWIILPDGSVKKAEKIASNLQSKNLSNCILAMIQKTIFPPPPSGLETYMTYKYIFKKTTDILTTEK